MGILFASMPLAWLGAQAEAMVRERERASYNRLLNWVRNPISPDVPSKLVLQSLARTFLLSGLTFYLAVLVLKFTFQTLFTLYPGFLSHVGITWAHLWVAATMGGLMSLRVKRAYAVLTTGIILFGIFAYSSGF